VTPLTSAQCLAIAERKIGQAIGDRRYGKELEATARAWLVLAEAARSSGQALALIGLQAPIVRAHVFIAFARPLPYQPKIDNVNAGRSGLGRYVAGIVWLTSAHKRDQVRCLSWVKPSDCVERRSGHFIS
jgi:hypothetical protein